MSDDNKSTEEMKAAVYKVFPKAHTEITHDGPFGNLYRVRAGGKGNKCLSDKAAILDAAWADAYSKLPAPTAEAAQPQDAPENSCGVKGCILKVVDHDWHCKANGHMWKAPAQEAVEEPPPALDVNSADRAVAGRTKRRKEWQVAEDLACRERQLRAALTRIRQVEEERDEAMDAAYVAAHEGWQSAHEKRSCGHPRAFYQDDNYPASEDNYDPETKTTNPPMVYRCLLCAMAARVVELEAQAGLLKIKYLLTDAMLPDDFDPDLEPLDRLTQWFTQNEPLAQEEEQKS